MAVIYVRGAPAELWRWVRVHAAATDRTCKEIVIQALREFRERRDGKANGS